MAFMLKPHPTFWAKVEIHKPGFGPDVIEIEFRHMGTSPAMELVAEVCSSVSRQRRIEILDQIVVGWRGADGDFSSVALHEVAESFPAFALAVIGAYLEELGGARRKN